MTRLRARWVDQSPVGCAVDTEEVHPPRRDVDHEQHGQPAQSHGVDVEEVCREQTAGLSA
jgi:hypothetical protein